VHLVLVEPQIAPNTGNLIRLSANTGVELHLVEPLGFSLNDSLLRRGGLDYHEYAVMTVHPDLAAARAALPGRWFAFSASGTRRYTDVDYHVDDVLMFGTERTGLSDEVLAEYDADHLLTIPMMPNNRSLNLGNAASIVVYEAWRQAGFDGAAEPPQRNAEMTAEVLAAEPYDR
jgi:tRNA (cytidine/uridine-2'-O-)-methyltransferase